MCEGTHFARTARSAHEDHILSVMEALAEKKKLREREERAFALKKPERLKSRRARKRARRKHAELSKDERPRIRAELYAVQPYCTYCRKPLVLQTSPISLRLGISFATIDHIIPISKGGTKELSNLTLACARCNSSKDGR